MSTYNINGLQVTRFYVAEMVLAISSIHKVCFCVHNGCVCVDNTCVYAWKWSLLSLPSTRCVCVCSTRCVCVC